MSDTCNNIRLVNAVLDGCLSAVCDDEDMALCSWKPMWLLLREAPRKVVAIRTVVKAQRSMRRALTEIWISSGI